MLNHLRLYSAIVMGLFVFLHLVNVSLMLVPGTLADGLMGISIEPWRTVPGTVLLAGAFAVHFGLALWAIYKRKTLRLQGWEIPQTVLGFLIPLLLIYHLMGTRFAHEFWDTNGDYTSQLLLFWYLAPAWCAGQALLLLVAWVHSYVGFHTWLRLRPWYSAYRPLISGFFVVVPTLALTSFVSMGLQVRALALEEGALSDIGEWRAEWGMSDAVLDSVTHYSYICMAGYASLIAATMLMRQLRISWLSRSKGSKVLYNGEVVVRLLPGETLLEALRAAGVQHASVCGGRGRCSTCRIRITKGLRLVEPPAPAEKEVLARVSAPPPVRLACQLRPTADLEVISLLAPSVGPQAAFSNPAQGEEQELAVLFCDLRGFTKLSEEKLPYDVVFILNRYFEAMGDAIEQAGGRVDKFIGDGVMALFGLHGKPAQGCSQALAAAHLMAKKLEGLNKTLANELQHPLEVGIGIEVGRVIVGEMGHGEAKSMTAIGSPVNTASRFQDLCKEFDCQLIISVQAASQSPVDLSGSPRRQVIVRGQAETREVYLIPSALDAEIAAAASRSRGLKPDSTFGYEKRTLS